ncbi:hypothetical protein AK830_g2305 [Neonectria ditissima]|uniref:DUF6594 domain-containing protein n=1 Tax=Neonectria ditissima TaxID=78410 RepID=A0A0P7B3G4_9HYPO|nr:hypothetical protein AK830_g2305 [Neonectria ditissima]
MSGALDVPQQRHMDMGDDGTMRKRRPLNPRPRPASSTNVASRSSRPHSTAVPDYEEDDRPPDDAAIHSPSPTSSPSMTGSTTSSTAVTGPVSSNSSRSTATEAAPTQKDDTLAHREQQKSRSRRPRPAQRPNSMQLSESESPAGTQSFIQLSSRDAGPYKARRRGPQISPSISSSLPSNIPDAFSERQAEPRPDLNWSPEFPEYAVVNQHPSQISPGFDPHFGGSLPVPQQYPAQNYGAPETPRGNAPFQYFQPSQYPNQMAAPNPLGPQPPGPERPPLGGYELVAATLAGYVGPPVRPMYRRFEATNHRILLSLQDQIITLEDTLAELDDIDSRNRQATGLPASEREERESSHPFHKRKERIMGLLCQKLHTYNTLLASFGHVQGLRPPTLNDIQHYKAFLDNERPIADHEASFIHADDLVLLEPNFTPLMEHKAALDDQSPPPTRDPEDDPKRHEPIPQRHIFNRGPLQDLAIGVVVAIFGPLFAFAVIHDFAGRMTIVVLFGVVVSMVLFGSGAFSVLTTTQDALMYGGAYVGGMTMLARFLQ